ncbi:hypothetical protein PM10SUCC1_31650 [Propionigenium maris DSM 9537]|uniref:Uncharacterized protein n=1 Tax=Propionigenium maris DSM 9537 TaxID=1123000 RepID=A0A9W6GPN5_9FUSO|nr:hypothetical protein [Propionigenium maris]GLI57651.1 hypothetical protein PM10SUCC1_31650 [Propionigenium maris DSM 9537]
MEMLSKQVIINIISAIVGGIVVTIFSNINKISCWIKERKRLN